MMNDDNASLLGSGSDRMRRLDSGVPTNKNGQCGGNCKWLITAVMIIAFLAVIAIFIDYLHRDTQRADEQARGYANQKMDCPVFCQGDILQTIQLAQLFNDSKYFVDMPLKYDSDTVIKNWQSVDVNDRDSLQAFIDDNFGDPYDDLENAEFDDWIDEPEFVSQIADSRLKKFAVEVHNIWKTLAKKPSQEVIDHPDQHTLFNLRHPLMIVPGGRFREVYYWDTYFVVKGLLASGLYDSAQKIVENLLGMVDDWGFVPNGARTYYKNRSQPPLLSFMVHDIYESMKLRRVPWRDFLKHAVPLLDEEYEFWMQNGKHAIYLSNHQLNRYYTGAESPRPEMYYEDWQLVQNYETSDQEWVWANIIAAAESGWDFSSRWFRDGEFKNSSQTVNVIPVDLNTIMCRNEQILVELHQALGNDKKSTDFGEARSKRIRAINELWDGEYNRWTDRDIYGERISELGVSSNFYPFYGSCFDFTLMGSIGVDDLIASFNDSGLSQPGGIASTLRETGEQWDFPNSWAPIEYFLVKGLEDLGTSDSQRLAFEAAENWVISTYLAFNSTGYMHEKYDCREEGATGSGGEYSAQVGFGLTNGIVLHFLKEYGDQISLPEDFT